jgi:hypothetical protein
VSCNIGIADQSFQFLPGMLHWSALLGRDAPTANLMYVGDALRAKAYEACIACLDLVLRWSVVRLAEGNTQTLVSVTSMLKVGTTAAFWTTSHSPNVTCWVSLP